MDIIPVEYNRGDKPFMLKGTPTKYTLLDFWAWAFSDVLTNITRGIVAEFIIATAIGIDIKQPREAWSKFDLTYRSHGIEVKSASYHQRWYQKSLSKISFTVPKRKGWDADTNKLDTVSKRQADIYILSLLAEKDRKKIDPLNIDQWQFWVVDTSFFDNRARSQHSITYNSLCKEIGKPISYSQLRIAVDKLIDQKTGLKFC
ncbi:MAG: hypothetical protein JRG72_04995 [Deltaproteobacteria bacterium]|nr:hypothetical protein [Deltaproteobacteria bacterium]